MTTNDHNPALAAILKKALALLTSLVELLRQALKLTGGAEEPGEDERLVKPKDGIGIVAGLLGLDPADEPANRRTFEAIRRTCRTELRGSFLYVDAIDLIRRTIEHRANAKREPAPAPAPAPSTPIRGPFWYCPCGRSWPDAKVPETTCPSCGRASTTFTPKAAKSAA